MKEQITKSQARKWAKALRSGKYSQTRGMLQKGEGYCCLGLACEIFMKEKEDNFLEGDMPDEQINAPEWLKNINEDLEEKTSESIYFDDPENEDNFHNVGFASLNDEKRFTFDEIADIIELVYVHKALD